MRLTFDSRRTASLDGTWEFYPGDHKLADLDDLEASHLQVPGLWEAQGYLELDGAAWYRRSFVLERLSGYWTLRFGAVMDLAEVYLNGELLGTHDTAFTPFELEATEALVEGENVLAVRVFDPSVGDPLHLSLAHGKQGWANETFPSRPSLYMTYGGIWQPVTLRRHGPVVVHDVFVNSDPDDVVVTMELRNAAPSDIGARVGMRTLGLDQELDVELPARSVERIEARFGATPAPRWSPASPVLHELLVDVHVDHSLSDSQVVRYGLRTIRIEGTRLLVNDEPYRMKSALVQGFRAEQLYAEGTREQIVDEVKQAQAMGFNTLRLHIKGFDPTYLDVCDELGMYLQCDLPVAEPVDLAELGADTPLAQHSVRAIREQVRRDRNHPSVILWAAMNEIGLAGGGARRSDQYEAFARRLYGAVVENDPTRPAIENDWVHPDPARVFVSPILTAHWYGRLHRDYLVKIDAEAAGHADCGRPLFVTEFGDWGLPEMPALPQPPFWDTREVHAQGLAKTVWPGTMARFVIETQRYQGLSDRLQAEVFRRHDHIGGYCVTELTDVPHELNGLLDLHRRPKKLAVEEMRRANQVVLPMLRLDSLVVAASQLIRAEVFVANDGPELSDVAMEARFGDFVALGLDEVVAVDASVLSAEAVAARFNESIAGLRVARVEGYRAAPVGNVSLVAPEVPGSHDLVIRLRAGGRALAENRYPVHVVDEPHAPFPVRVLGRPATAEALAAVGAIPSDEGPAVVGEGDLPAVASEARRALEDGSIVLVLAQSSEAAAHYPIPVTMLRVATEWGSSVFQFTTDEGAIPSLPRRAVLVAEDSNIQATSVLADIAGKSFPETAVVVAYKPAPRAATGTILGSAPVGAGRMIFCQYRLCDGAVGGDVAARAVLADLVRWAAQPRPVLSRERITKEDGRHLTFYTSSFEAGR
ncbi:MAG: hypothetical protein M3314_09135 [Actinomycetota bacterium]|nr:hypothetical protein [Actinomycetota bacterium]